MGYALTWFRPLSPSLADGDLVTENHLAVAFLTEYAISPGHCLVIPRRHVTRLTPVRAHDEPLGQVESLNIVRSSSTRPRVESCVWYGTPGRSAICLHWDMHLLAVVLIPFNADSAAIRPLVARDAAVDARLDTLMFRYLQPDDEWVWGVDPSRGFVYDWWILGGRWRGWGRTVRTLMRKQHHRPTRRSIPRFIEHNAVWSQDLTRVRLIATHLPDAILTPHGEWKECSMTLHGGMYGSRAQGESRLDQKDPQANACLPGVSGDWRRLSLLNPGKRVHARTGRTGRFKTGGLPRPPQAERHGSITLGERRTSTRHCLEGTNCAHRNLERPGAWPLSGRPIERGRRRSR